MAIKRLKNNWHELSDRLKEAEAGSRFTKEYEHHVGNNDGTPKRLFILITASLLAVLGLLLSIPPGVPGFLLWVPALAMVASRSLFAARLLDRTEVLTRSAIEKISRLFN